MTTANLSVGLVTKAARAEATAFKTWLKSELGSIKVSVDPAMVGPDLQKALKASTIKVTVDSTTLAASVDKAVKSALAKPFRVQIDSANLTAQVQAAVAAGLSGGRISLGGMSPTTSAGMADIKTTIQSILIPAVDELAKAAALVGGTSRRLGGTGGGVLAASSRYASTDPVTGERVSVSRKLDNPEAVLAQVRGQIAKQRTDAEQEALNREGARVGPDWIALNAARDRVALMRRRRAEAEQASLNREGARVGPDWEALTAARDRAALRRRRETEREQQTLNKEGAQVGPDRDSLLAARDRVALMRRRRAEAEQEALNREGAQVGPDWRSLMAARDRAAARRRREVEVEQQALNKEGALVGPDWRTLMTRRDQAALERRRRAEAEQNALNREGSRVGPDRDSLLAMRDQAVRDARAKAAAQARADIAAFYASARIDAAKEFKGAGVGIAAAQATAARFGVAPTAEMLGKNSGMLQRAEELDRYRRASEMAALAKKRLADNMNDAHSAARGLAGSLGALWVTWGSTAPLVAAAGIGAALRSVYTVGKDVEYQLKFVQVLSDGTAISVDKFGDAVRGSLVVPTQAAEALRALAQNGLNARQALQALPQILDLATVGEMGLAEAALGATGVMAAFNLQVNDLGRVGDVFAKAAAVSNTSVSQMVESMRQASTVSDQYHVSLEETAASLAIMAKRNITGSAAGTAMRNMLVELATPHNRAKEAMASLNLQLYDSSNQLRSYGDVLGEIRQKTILLNEKGRLTFLNEVFGERGAKAANAILSDFDQYQRMLVELQTKSKGFAASVSEALKETTQGKVKALVTEFQLSSVAAFEKASGSVNYFIDRLRAAVATEDFRNMIQVLVKGVTSLTTYLVENGKVVAGTIAVWMGLRIAESLVGGIMMLGKAVLFAEGAMLAAGRAARIAWASVTGGLGLVALLGVEFLLLRSRTDEASEAQRQFGTRLNLQSDDLERQIRQLQESNALLARRTQLLRQGYTGSQADSIIAGEGDTKAGDKFKADVEAARKQLAEARAVIQGAEDRTGPVRRAIGGVDVPLADLNKYKQAERMIPILEENLAKAQKVEEMFRQKVALKREEDEKKESDRRLDAAKRFNDRLYEIRSTSKDKKVDLTGLFITQGEAEAGSKEIFDAMLKEREERLNGKLGSFSAKDPQQRTNDLAASRAMIKALNDEQAAFRQTVRFRKELEDARYSEKLYGPQLSAVLAEQRAIDGISASLAIEVDQRNRLNQAMRSGNLHDSDRKALQSEIEHRSANIELLRDQLEHEVRISALRAVERARQSSAEAQLERSKLAADDATGLHKQAQETNTKVLDSGAVAEMSARLKIEERYSDAIVKREQSVATAKAAIRALEDEGMSAAEGYTQQELERLNAAHANLSVQESLLLALKDQAKVAADVAGFSARVNDRYMQTAEYGFRKFWKEYQEQGLSSAKMVESAMKSASDKMGDALATFVTTGKLNFKSLVASILADVARMQASKAFAAVLNYVINAFGGTGGGGGSTGTSMNGWSSGGGYGTGTGVAGFAGGGVMTPQGRKPLKSFDAGGVARQPMYAEFGEGRKPEAYVPLQDGRTIPVTVSGAGGGDVNVSMSVTVQTDGRTAVQSDSSGERAAELARSLEAAMTEKIVKEKRPGGLLYAKG